GAAVATCQWNRFWLLVPNLGAACYDSPCPESFTRRFGVREGHCRTLRKRAETRTITAQLRAGQQQKPTEAGEDRMKKALITGITGQDGSYLAEYLLSLDYEVHGFYRRTSTGNLSRIEHILDKITLYKGDLLDAISIGTALQYVEPDEVYNLADQDNVGWSFKSSVYSCQITATAPVTILEAILGLSNWPEVRFFQPVSATMFGFSNPKQHEKTPFNPGSPYAVAKTTAYYFTKYYREHRDLFASTGIMFNHDSERRSDDYLLHHIANSAIAIARGESETMSLGNLNLEVDIGFAGDYVKAMHTILQLDKPDDFCVGTGMPYKIGELADEALSLVGVFDRESIIENSEFSGLQPTLICNWAKMRDATKWVHKYDALSLLQKMIRDKLERRPLL
ncbi:MAG: GDP-mannose 4,6-dehydratase, partial [Nitrosopumilus sp.]